MQAHDHSGGLSPGDDAVQIQSAVGVALEQALGHSPGHSGLVLGADSVGVGKGAQIGLRLRAAGAGPQQDRQGLTGNGLAVGRGLGGGHGVQSGGQGLTGNGGGRGEGGLRLAGHQAVLGDVGHGLIVPIGLADIGVAGGLHRLLGHGLVDDGDTAVAGDLSVLAVGGDGGQAGGLVHREGLHVIGQNHVVLRHVVQNVHSAVEHGEAVAQVAEGVVVAGQVVLGGQIQRLIRPGLVVEDLHVGHTVRAGGAAGPHALVVLLDGGGDGGVDGVAQTGDMEEAAVLHGAVSGHVLGAPLQSVQELLAGNGLQAGHVAEGVDRLAGLIGDLPGDGLVADAAAIHHGHVHIQIHLVEEVVQGVGGKVTGVGLLLADQPVALGVIVVQRHLGIADDLAQLLVQLSHPGVLNGLHLGVGGHFGQILGGEELGGDGAVSGNGHLTHSVQIGAGLGEDHGAAALIRDLLHGDRGVGVAVNESVQPGGVGDHLAAGPGLGGLVHAQVAQGDDIVRLGGGGVDGVLHRGVESLAVRTPGDPIDVVAVLILEVGGSGLGEGLGGGDADEGDLYAAHLEHLVAVQHILTGHAVGLVVEVAGHIGEVRSLDGSHAAVHAVVKLVVAQSGQVIARCVHQLGDGGALVHGTVGGALDVVAGVHQQDVLQGVLVGGHLGVGQILGDVGMDVVGVQYSDPAGGLGFTGCRRLLTGGLCGLLRRGSLTAGGALVLREGGDRQAQGHGQRQQQSEKLLSSSHVRSS